jgi:hypothetical protein
MAISQKSLFKLSAYLDFSLEGRANMILNLEKLRNLFRKIAKFCAKEKQNPIAKLNRSVCCNVWVQSSWHSHRHLGCIRI